MKLTAENVHATVKYCLPESMSDADREKLQKDEEVPGIILVKGVVGGFAFVTAKLEEKRADVEAMLKELPVEFMKTGGGGYSFLNACMTKDGDHWGEQPTVGELVCLGLGLKLVDFVMPREMWPVLPGGMPYFVVAA